MKSITSKSIDDLILDHTFLVGIECNIVAQCTWRRKEGRLVWGLKMIRVAIKNKKGGLSFLVGNDNKRTNTWKKMNKWERFLGARNPGIRPWEDNK